VLIDIILPDERLIALMTKVINPGGTQCLEPRDRFGGHGKGRLDWGDC